VQNARVKEPPSLNVEHASVGRPVVTFDAIIVNAPFQRRDGALCVGYYGSFFAIDPLL